MGGLHHQLFRMRGPAQKREIRGNSEFEITHYPLRTSRKRSVQEPRRRRCSLREVAVEPGAEQPEAQAALVLYAEVIPCGPSVLAPPGAFDTFGAFGSDYLVQRAPPSEAQRRPIRYFRHRLDRLRPRQQPQWARRKLYLLA